MFLASLLGSDSCCISESAGHEGPKHTFRYRPLDHEKHSIRLLRVLPELSLEGYVRCEIWHTAIEPKYQCLSYRWGSSTDMKTVLIRDREVTNSREESCRVGQNLHEFLHAARANPDLADTFWIDALCIDQDNVPERNHQVTQMGDIYSQASRVIIWLGRYRKVVRYGGKDEDYDAFWTELDRNEYWQRAWITQEFVLPRHIDFLINDVVVPYSDINVASSSMQPRVQTLRNMRTLYGKQRNSLWHRLWWGGISLSDDFFLLDTRHVESSVPRDRIFSLLALLQEGRRITVDYASPVSELVYHLLRLYKGRLTLWTILQFISLVGDKQQVYSEISRTSGPYAEFRVFFVGREARATNWDSTAAVLVVDNLLGGEGLGDRTLIRGMGFTIKRKDSQSLMLSVRVTLSLMSVLLNDEELTPWSIPDLPVAPHPSFDAELEAWIGTSFFHYVYTRIFGTSTSRTSVAWSTVKIGWDATPNGKSIPHNLVVMGLSLGWGC